MRHYIKYALCLLSVGTMLLSGCHTTPDPDSSQAGSTANTDRTTGTAVISESSSGANTTAETIISSGSSIRTSVPSVSSTDRSSTQTAGTRGTTTAAKTQTPSPVLSKEDILAELNPFRMLQLGSVRFVGKTNDVGTAIDQTDLVIFSIAEFLDGANVKSATFTCAKFFS